MATYHAPVRATPCVGCGRTSNMEWELLPGVDAVVCPPCQEQARQKQSELLAAIGAVLSS